ncbi:uncharacterized protein [Nicotiana sylvestris]|uniref:uncharacterized protein n=1 Tax=Nicotiana sylvestris TaxID=4096 RepID=UPI00388C3F2D
MHNRYQSKIRVNDDQLGAPSDSVYPKRSEDRIQRDIDIDWYHRYSADRRNNRPGCNPVRNDRSNDQGQNSRGLMSKSGFDKHVEPKEAPQLSEYNFSIDASGIVSATGRIKDTRWPRPLQTDPAQRNLNQMCKYHGTHGHRTEDCRQLREEVARLFNEGHLREFLSDRAKNHFKYQDTNKKNEHEEPSENIIRLRVIEQLGLQDQIVPAARVLNSFNMASETTKGEIMLPVNVTGTIQETKFHVIKDDMRYNALLERPWIHNMRAVPSTLHQVLKFPTLEGIKMVYDEQPVSKDMFSIDEVIPVSTLSSTKGPESKEKQEVK